ncbi:MAG: hypothetical protein NUV91_09855 [Candidatus Omnitrophica bacterium]|nr:hypothetical protein [Candidatus Omnitrophota bacterium]
MTKARASFLMIFFLGFLVSPCYSQGEVQIQGVTVEEGKRVSLTKQDLQGKSRIEFKLTPSEDVDSVRISFDGGKSWDKMKKKGSSFIYRHRPRSIETMDLSFSVESLDGTKNVYSTDIIVSYEKSGPQESIDYLLRDLKSSYENENSNAFLNLIAFDFPGQVEFREAIDQDFRNHRNIRLFFQKEEDLIGPSGEEAIYDVLWKKNFQDTSGANFSDSETITMKFKKQPSGWKLAAMRDNTIFGSTLIGTVDLTVGSISFDGGTTTLTAVINNNGSKLAENIKIDFYFIDNPALSSTKQLHGSQVVVSLGVNSQVTISRDFSSLLPLTNPHDFIIILDPENTIGEVSERNNEAVVRFAP